MIFDNIFSDREFIMRKLFLTSLMFMIFNPHPVFAENIYFCDSIYKLDQINNQGKTSISNEYFKDNENTSSWSSKIIINYLPEVSNPLKYASDFDKKITKEENLLLLKFVQNKKRDIAVLSYLENEITDGYAYFIYNIWKFEKHPQKGIMTLKFAKRYKINSDNDIKNFANEIKKVNDDYMERIIISPIPPIVKTK